MDANIVSSDPIYCDKCKQWKPRSEFYARSGMPHLILNDCKECRKKMSARQVRVPRTVSSVETETLVIERLKQFGIPALPGKALSVHFTDILAWGSIPIEAKSSNYHDSTRGFRFGFTPKQHAERVLGDAIVLVCQFPDKNTFHVFPSDHECFFHESGKHKTGLEFIVGKVAVIKHHRRHVLTQGVMDEFEDAWYLIENRRQELIRELLAG